MADDDYQTSCYNDTFWDYDEDNHRNTVLAVKGCMGALSLVAAIVSIILFFMFRCYKPNNMTEIGIIERLILYSAVASIARSVVVILQLTGVKYDKYDRDHVYLCKIIGFLDQWSSSWIFLTLPLILMHVCIQTMIRLGMVNELDKIKKRIIEVFYIVFPVLFPLLFSWMPFILHGGYGMTGAWCWICRIEYQMIFWFAPSMVCQMVNLIFLLIVYPILFFKIINKDDRRDLIKQHVPLLLSLSIYIMVYIICLITRCINYQKTNLPVWILEAIITSCWGFVFSIIVMLYLLALFCLQPRTRKELETEEEAKTLQNTYDILSSSMISYVAH